MKDTPMGRSLLIVSALTRDFALENVEEGFCDKLGIDSWDSGNDASPSEESFFLLY